MPMFNISGFHCIAIQLVSTYRIQQSKPMCVEHTYYAKQSMKGNKILKYCETSDTEIGPDQCGHFFPVFTR